MESSRVRPVHVGLLGFYDRGNFGDDLMALLFAEAVRAAGAEPVVRGLCRPYADAFGLKVFRSTGELLKSVDLVILGGGGLLCSHPQPPLRTLREGSPASGLAAGRGKGANSVLAMASRLQVPFYALSIGGDGTPLERIEPPLQRDFIRACRFATVRNRRDLDVLAAAGVPGAWYPDVVWQTSRLVPLTRRRRARLRVGINVYHRNLRDRGATWVAPLLLAATRWRRDVDFVFIDSGNAACTELQGIGRFASGPNVRVVKFDSPREDLATLASLDLIVSSRLHVGLACLSYGVPFLSLFGEAKTAVMLEDAGLGHCHVGHRRLPWFLGMLLGRRRLREFVDGFAVPRFDEIMAESAGHLAQVPRILADHAVGR